MLGALLESLLLEAAEFGRGAECCILLLTIRADLVGIFRRIPC